MSEKMKQLIQIFIWSVVAVICFANTTEETPKECIFGQPEYNATLCNATCAKEEHMNQTYCTNTTVTPAMSTTVSPPAEVHHEEIPEVTVPTLNISKNIDLSLTTPMFEEKNSSTVSSGISLKSSLILSVSCFLFFSF